MFASIAFSQSSRVHLRKSPGGGPPALLIRMSGFGHAASAWGSSFGRRDVPDEGRHLGAGRLADFFRGRFERLAPARGDEKLDAVLRGVRTRSPCRGPSMPRKTSAVLPRMPRSMV
jgi:hypothetical protein